MSGTFIARANVTGDVNRQANGAANLAILSGTADSAIALRLPADLKYISCAGAAPASFNVQANVALFLDGSLIPITSVNDLPAGFTVTAATIIIASSWNGGFDDYINANSDGSITWANIDIGPTLQRFGNGASVTYTVPTSIPMSLPISNLAIFSALGFRANYTSGMNLAVEQLIITGTYDLAVSFQYTLETPTDPVFGAETGPPAVVGSTITVTSDDPTVNPDAMDLSEISQVDIQFLDDLGNVITINVPITLWLVWTNLELFQFTLPDFGVYEPQTIEIIFTGNGTQFSGSVVLGKLVTIYFINAPGIYRLVTDKTNDTLYDVVNGGTIDVKIPNPTANTGFLP